MKTIRGWFKAYDIIEVEDDATDEEIRAKMADSMSTYYFTNLHPENVIIEGEVEPYSNKEEDEE